MRQADEGEKTITLDGAERTCTTDTLLISDTRGPIALAGVQHLAHRLTQDRECLHGLDKQQNRYK